MNINEMLKDPQSGEWFDVAMRVRVGDNDVLALKLLKYLLEIGPDDLVISDIDEIINALHWWHTTYAVLHDNRINDNYPSFSEPPPPAAGDDPK